MPAKAGIWILVMHASLPGTKASIGTKKGDSAPGRRLKASIRQISEQFQIATMAAQAGEG